MIPSMKVSMSSSTCLPSGPAASSASACSATTASVCGAGQEVLEAGDEADRAQARRVDRGDPCVEAGLLQQQAAVLGDEPARGPDAVVVPSWAVTCGTL